MARETENASVRKRREADDRRWHALIAPAALVLFGLLVSATLVVMIVDLSQSASGLMQIVELTKSLVWPVFLLFAIAFFYGPIFGFLENLSEVSVKVGGNETVLKTRETQARVVGLVAAATATSTEESQVFKASNKGLVGPQVEPVPQTVARTPLDIVDSISNVGAIVNERSLPKFARGSILWVDDRPSNNAYLIAAFRELGMRVDTALSTDEAMRYLRSGSSYDAIITDMGRPPDARAGYTLLKELREQKSDVPVIIFASGSDSDENRRAAKEAGAIDSTTNPQRVFDLVTSIVISRPDVATVGSVAAR